MFLIVSCFTQLNFARCLISAGIFYHFLAWIGSLFILPRFRFPGSQVLYNSLVCCGETLGPTFFAFRTFLARERVGGGDQPSFSYGLCFNLEYALIYLVLLSFPGSCGLPVQQGKAPALVLS